jgi:hypothetical protein
MSFDRREDVSEVEFTVFDHGLTKSEKQMCYSFDGDRRRGMKFLPVSQIIEKTPHPKGKNMVVIRIPEWLAKKEGLI